MNAGTIRKIGNKVSRQFPEIAGSRPKVTQQKSGREAKYLLTFKGSGSGPGGRALSRTVRVIADERGNIIKVSTSR